MNSLNNIASQFEKGYLSVDDLSSGVIEILYSPDGYSKGIEKDLENLLNSLERALGAGHSDSPLLALIGLSAGISKIERPLKSLSRSPFRKIKKRVRKLILAGLLAQDHRGASLDVVSALPKTFLNEKFLNDVFLTIEGLNESERLEAYEKLYETAVEFFGVRRTYELLIKENLENPKAAGLLVEAMPTYPYYYQSELYEALKKHINFLTSNQLLKYAIGCSIKGRLEESGLAALEFVKRDPKNIADLKTAAFVLWVSGLEEEALSVLRREEVANSWANWGTVARDSLAAFILASSAASPMEVIEILIVQEGLRGSGNSINSVGLMRGRINFMLMEAFLKLGKFEEAQSYALGVLNSHKDRVYDLHMQVGESEFPVALVDIVAVNISELKAARAILET